MINTYAIYLGTKPIANVRGIEYAYKVFKKTAELADLLGKTASLVWDGNGEEVASYPDEEDPEEDWEEPDWDDLESGFDPYEGCYTYDC